VIKTAAINNKRLGETELASNGQMMTIIRYAGVNDIDVEFEDGTVVKHSAYKQFVNHELKNPNIQFGTYVKTKNAQTNRVGQSVISKSGLKMTIIQYANAHNVDVQFEDGIIVISKNYANFKTGSIGHPTIFENGIVIIEFAYRKGEDWYYVCSHADWSENKILPVKEICSEPIMTSKNKTERRTIYGSLVNEVGVASNGMSMTCLDDNGSKDITVEFEDGEKMYHQRRESFLAGHIRHPGKIARISKRSIANHIGESWYDKNGLRMTIIEYYSNSNVTIKYDDGTILTDKEYRIIKKGGDLYPKTRVGEEKEARNGLKMKIINDEIWHDVHIEFEDGVVVKGCTHASFDLGAVKHPTISRKHKLANEREGIEKVMKNGLKCKVVKYIHAKDVGYVFENGLKVINRDWASFEHMRIGIPRHIGDLFIKEFAYRIGDEWFYIVEQKGCNDTIISVKQLYELTNEEDSNEKR